MIGGPGGELPEQAEEVCVKLNFSLKTAFQIANSGKMASDARRSWQGLNPRWPPQEEQGMPAFANLARGGILW